MTQMTKAQLNGKTNGRSSSAETLSEILHDDAPSVTQNGATNGAHDETPDETPDVRPNVQQSVVAAARIAEARKMPLRTTAMQNGNSPNGNALNGNALNGNGQNGNNQSVNTAIEYSKSALNDGKKRVDIAATLDGIAPQMKCVEAEIERLISTPVKLVADVAGHTLGAGGKRLRPALTIFASQICRNRTAENVAQTQDIDARTATCAAVIELTHTTALLHDDVIDLAQTRRGKPAANLVWGNETSVLVGDYLCAQCFVAMAAPQFREVLPFMAQATAELCAGELLETQTRGLLSMSQSQYLDIIALKTASLTDCACRVGAISANATVEDQEKLARYGRDLGLAFQIVDDVFDVVSSEARLGKPVGNDIREGDITLPMLRAMQVVSEKERDELCAIVGKDPISDEEVTRALGILRGCDAIEYSMSLAARFVQSAKAQLDDFPESAAKTALCDIADYVLSREK